MNPLISMERFTVRFILRLPLYCFGSVLWSHQCLHITMNFSFSLSWLKNKAE